MEAEVVVVSSKGQVTLPSKLRKKLRIVKGEQFRVVSENGSILLVPVPKLSGLAGIDKEVFSGRAPSLEVEDMRKKWDREFEKRI